MTETQPGGERDTIFAPIEEINALAAKAQHWGVMTWIANIGGCFVGMIPLALPLTILLTIITFFTGIAAMVFGARGYRLARAHDDAGSARSALLGIALGGAHMVIVILVSVAAVLILQNERA